MQSINFLSLTGAEAATEGGPGPALLRLHRGRRGRYRPLPHRRRYVAHRGGQKNRHFSYHCAFNRHFCTKPFLAWRQEC